MSPELSSARRKSKPRWSAAEDRRITQGYEAGIPIIGIAAIVDRSVSATQQRLSRLRAAAELRGDLVQTRRPKWTEEEDFRLVELLKSGGSPASAAASIGRPLRSIESRARSLAETDPTIAQHLPAREVRRATGWSADELKEIRAQYAAGATYQAIADTIGRTPSQIVDCVRSLQAHDPALASRKPRWSTIRRQRLAKRRNEGATLRQLEIEFRITRGTLTYQLRRARSLGLLD